MSYFAVSMGFDIVPLVSDGRSPAAQALATIGQRTAVSTAPSNIDACWQWALRGSPITEHELLAELSVRGASP